MSIIIFSHKITRSCVRCHPLTTALGLHRQPQNLSYQLLWAAPQSDGLKSCATTPKDLVEATYWSATHESGCSTNP
jgi:hypothetical protein